MFAVCIPSDTVEASQHWGGGGGGGGDLTDLSSGYEVMLPLKIFKTKFPSLLIRIITIDGKYKTSYVDFFVMSI